MRASGKNDHQNEPNHRLNRYLHGPKTRCWNCHMIVSDGTVSPSRRGSTMGS